MSGAGFDITPARLTRAGGDLGDVAGRLDDALAQLRSALDGLGDMWGNDEIGAKIGQVYRQVAAQAFTAIDSYAGEVDDAGRAVRASAEGYQGWDGDAGQRMSDLEATNLTPVPADPVPMIGW